MPALRRIVSANRPTGLPAAPVLMLHGNRQHAPTGGVWSKIGPVIATRPVRFITKKAASFEPTGLLVYDAGLRIDE